MMRKCLSLMLVAGAVTFAGCTAHGQMTVHAVSGKVTAVHPDMKTMDVDVEDGTRGHFKVASETSVPLSFDNDLRASAVDASTYHQVGHYVVVYYYGFGDDRTAVAVQDLGEGPFDKVEGTVKAFDRHKHVLAVQTAKDGVVNFKLSDKAVVDIGMGLESARKYSAGKGYTVRVTSTEANGEKTAVFVRSRE